MNFLINALFEDGAFIRGRRFLEGSVYKRAVFKRGNAVFENLLASIKAMFKCFKSS